ncbi:MAG: hypothetical protein ACYCW6_11365, partial [Candidatus Xenobia bacterium]
KDEKPDDILSKHVLMSGYDNDVRFAGECWAERYTKPDGTQAVRLNINNNSGTYRPTAHAAEEAGEYLRHVFPGVEVVVHAQDPPVEKAARPDYIKDYPVPAGQPVDLEGKKITLTDKAGNKKNYTMHKFTTVNYDMAFLDNPSQTLLKDGGALRLRTELEKDGSVKKIDLESKMAQPGVEFKSRIAGSRFNSQAEWQAARNLTLTSPDANDPAVEAARKVAGSNVPLSEMAWKHTSRDVYFVTPNFPPLISRLDPQFIVSIDHNTARQDQNGPSGAPFTVLQPQIFIKLPWTKHVTQPRIEQFESLCDQLSSQLGLKQSAQTPYAEAVQHLP